MTLLNPIWLWALGGLSIPVAIHLLSRKEGKTIRIGSIRFLTETATSKFSSIRLNEVALLAIRSLLIILIVLFLASLVLSTTNSNPSQKWVVIERGLENNEQLKTLLDSLQKNDYEVHSLSSGFPIPEDDTVNQPSDYYTLSEELSQKENVQAIVIASNSISGFKGKRISLPQNIIWLSYPVSSIQDLEVDSLPPLDTVKITLAYDKDFQSDKKIMLAALKALPAKITVEEIEIKNLKSLDTDWIIWLSTNNLHHTGRSLRFSEDALGYLVVQESKNQFILTKRLTVENALEQHLAVQLMNMLFNEQIAQEINKQDKRTISAELAWSTEDDVQSLKTLEAGQSADKILILLIAFVFITERFLAFYRKQ
jgi:hypothetical protein